MAALNPKETFRFPVKESYVEANGLAFCVEERGKPDGPPVVFIMGLGCQMTFWPDALLNGLAEQGYRVICFDNRDIGLSEKIPSQVRVDTRVAYLKHKIGVRFDSNYTLIDMALDTAHLIDQMALGSAHVVGISMGGMIAQLLASRHPNRVRSLTVLMSSTNAPNLPPPDLGLMLKLGWAGPAGHDEASAVARWINFWQAIQSPRYPANPAEIESRVRSGYRRNYSPGGTLRQLQAILASGSIAPHSSEILAPTLVLHGRDDPLLKPRCGKAVARAIGHADLEIITGLGHDLPEALIPEFVDLIGANCRRAETQTADQA